MSLKTVEINSVKIVFDKEKTKEYRTDFNKSCDCQEYRNFYKHIENNSELVEFLSNFGIDYNYTEEVFSWDLDDDKDSLIHHEGYYGVFGKIEGEEFDFEKFGVKITFQKGVHRFLAIGQENIFGYVLRRIFPIYLMKKEIYQLRSHKN